MFAAVLIVAIPFLFVGWVVNRVLEHRARMQGIAAPRPIPALPMPTPNDVERRLANLEAIVASLDFDFVEKLSSRPSGPELRDRGHAA